MKVMLGFVPCGNRSTDQEDYYAYLFSRLLSYTTFLALSLMTFDAIAQILESQNRRCKTQAAADEPSVPPFLSCSWIQDPNVASVSDFSFTTEIYFNSAPTYTERWTGPNFFKENTYNYVYDQNAQGYFGWGYWAPCGPRTTQFCFIFDGSTYYTEHFDGVVSTLTAADVGNWVYEELLNGSVYERKEFEVKELAITALSGDDQIGIVDQDLSDPLVLQLKSFDGDGIANEVIGWSISGPSGSKLAAVYGIGSGSETNSEGIDEATIHLGTNPGTYTVTLNNRRITPSQTQVSLLQLLTTFWTPTLSWNIRCLRRRLV